MKRPLGGWRGPCLALLAGALWHAGAAAQEPQDSILRRQQRTIDSLAAALRALEARLDSLSRPQAPDTAGAGLEAIRAAALAAAGRDTTELSQIGSRVGGRSQSALNPEISVTGDVRAGLDDPGPQTRTFVPREFEVGFQSALDPYSMTKVFAAFDSSGEVGIEEAYAYWTGLPGHLRVDIGKFRQQMGELNRWHLHALPEDEYPLALQRYFGDEGLTGIGVSFYAPLPFSGRGGTFEWYGQLTRGDNATLFAGGNRPSYLSELSGFWQLSRSTFGQLSVTGLYGTNPDVSLKTVVGAVAARFTWRPPELAKYREFTVRSEVFAFRRDTAGVGPTKLGGYVDATWKLSSRFIVGVRADLVEPPAPLDGHEWQVIPTLTFWQSEFVYLRLQWTHHHGNFTGALPYTVTTDRLGLQVVWAMGPHKHELF
jgi:hypothetical protein